jgi:hypothetical protein
MMRGFVFLMIVISASYVLSDTPRPFLHSPENLLFHVHRRFLSSKMGFGPRNER